MSSPLQDLLPIALDMTASLSAGDRFERLVRVVADSLPCDATALLRAEGENFVPVATRGLSRDVVGRRFVRREHPRLDVIAGSEEPIVFEDHSKLPDPFDGFVESLPQMDVHACLGCALRVNGKLVGLLTADAVRPGAFDAVDRAFLTHLGALAAAAMQTSDLIDALERRATMQGVVARDLVQDVLERRGGLLIGDGPAMTRLKREIDVVARSDFPVLVTGETGVGKELVVRTLHSRSRRSDRPLVYLNCAALPDAIAESELFGHRKGAFTGAEDHRPGKFRIADGASLLLDEIGELAPHLQPKLLRALQDGEVQPVGVDVPERVDVRVLAATNRDLEREVREGRFRADLLHRLDVCRIDVPPLRDRLEDIPRLLGHFADRARRQLGTGAIRFDRDVIPELSGRSWPGNVRELENAVSRAILHASARVVHGEPVLVDRCDVDGQAERRATTEPSAESGSSAQTALDLRAATNEFQRRTIQKTLAAAGGNWSEAARRLGMDRSNLHRLGQRLGLR
ncbi:MAG: nitric oxide reductase transcriptional regulator NorR [Planctomycetes bacterium]|nr:nitric oxide reductase transcriptional regulator NorR [Planctomycetota bacterium]